MAFTFVVEDGTGLTTANSYVSVVEADDIVAVNIHASPKWVALTTAEKEKLLAWASRFLDAHTRWYGTKTVETSGLRWPRKGVYDRDNILLADNVIPHQLKVATASMAVYLIENDRTVERSQDALTRLQVDVVELEFREGYTLALVPNHMEYLVAGLGAISGGGGIRFKPIIR